MAARTSEHAYVQEITRWGSWKMIIPNYNIASYTCHVQIWVIEEQQK